MNNRTRRIIKITAVVCGTLLLLGAGTGYYVLRKFVYRHTASADKLAQWDAASARILALPHAHNVTFTTTDNQQLRGILINRPHAHRVIMLCHGYRMVKEEMEHLINLFPTDTILLFDFRAHGQSTGNFVSFGFHEKQDVFAAINFLKTTPSTKNLPIIGLGISMGGASLLAAAADGAPFKALIIDSSFASLSDQVHYQFTKLTGLPAFLLPMAEVLFEYLTNATIKAVVPAQFIRTISCPVLIIHSQDDRFTPIEHAHTLFANCGHGSARCWIGYKAKHGFLSRQCPKEYAQHINTFLAQIPR